MVLDNDFASVVKILSQNKDSSINYEVVVEDTLFAKGNFKVPTEKDSYSGYYLVMIKLPHDEFKNDLWGLRFVEFEETKSLLFYVYGPISAPSYLYNKIEEED